jgi:hypothetical protein
MKTTIQVIGGLCFTELSYDGDRNSGEKYFTNIPSKINSQSIL